MCLVGALKHTGQSTIHKIEYDSEPYGDALRQLQEQIEEADLLVLFNAKRDLHWLRRYGIQFQHKYVWDVQIAHFVMGGQEEPYPSLDGVAEHYKLGLKSNDLYEEFFSKQIDTDTIPLGTLVPYLEQDLALTAKCYEAQMACLKDNPAMLRLIRLQCIDLLILEEMEWNGLILDVEACASKGDDIRQQIESLDRQLSTLVDGLSINWNSGDQLSAVLYGGEIKTMVKRADGVYKTGKRAGQIKYRNELQVTRCERLVQPLPRTELAKYGYWETNEGVLRSLRATGKAKAIITVLLERAKLEKLVSSYYEGLPRQISDMGWDGNTIHGTLNQCVAATGRLSSSKPNLQNNPKEIDKLFRSRYED